MIIQINIDDRLIERIKKNFRGKRLLAIVTALLIATSALLYSQVTIPNAFVSGEVISAAQVNANFQALQTGVNEATPIGTITAYGGTTLPDGWLWCDGTPYATIGTYAGLYTVIQTNFGHNGAGTFRVPDMRGMFMRGVSGGRGDGWEDPDVGSRSAVYGGNATTNVGSYQGDSFLNHTHRLRSDGNSVEMLYNGGGGGTCYSPCVNPTSSSTVTDTGNSNTTGAESESRPNNIHVYFIIKYR